MSAAPCRHRDGHPGTDHGWLAERDGFIVVSPIVTSYPFLPVRARNCWGFFIERHCHEGLSEPADLRRILHAVEDEFATDPARRYVVGLSSGAAMAVALTVAYSEDIAAAGAVPGLPYGEEACAVAQGFFTGIARTSHGPPSSRRCGPSSRCSRSSAWCR